MNAPPNGHKVPSDLLERMLEGKPDDTKVRVLNLVYRLKINPDDPFFLVFIAMGYLQTLIEDSPQEWEDTFQQFKEELDEWTSIHLETLETLAKRAESEKNLSDVSSRLATLLEQFMLSENKPSNTSPAPLLASAESKAISQIPELLEVSRSMEGQVQKLLMTLPQLLQHHSRNMTANALPSWLAILLTLLTLSSGYNFLMLQGVRDAVLRQPVPTERR
jgi:hypothetical protein